jgi:tetratricopeptide (TPR) repeat protein
LAEIFNALGSIHLELKNLDQAHDYFVKAVNNSKNQGDDTALARSKSLLGACLEKMGDYPQAIELQNQSLTLYGQLGDDLGISQVHDHLGSIYEDLNRFDLSLSHFNQALENHPKQPDRLLSNILNNLGDVYRKTGQYDQAMAFTQQSLQTAQTIHDKDEIGSAYKDLSKTEALLGNYPKAFGYLQTFQESDSELQDIRNTDQANALQRIYNTQQQENQIRSLVQKSQIAQARQNLMLGGILVLLLGGVSLFFYTKKKRQQDRKIQAYEKRMLEVELEKKLAVEDNLQDQVQLKNSALSRYSLHLSQKNKILSSISDTLKKMVSRDQMDLRPKLKSLIKEIDFNLSQEHEWDEFMHFFQEIHPAYTKRITDVALEPLSPAEKRLGILLRLNLSSKEIAGILRVTPDSVRVARYRLRKKLPIGQKQELTQFLMGL